MSTITETAIVARKVPMRGLLVHAAALRKVPIRGLLQVAAIWFAGMGVAAIAVQPDSVVGFGPPATMISAVVASDGYLLNAGRFYVAARTGPANVRSLYATGLYQTIEVAGVRAADSVTIVFTGVPRLFVGRVNVEGVKDDRLDAALDSATQLQAGTPFSDTKAAQAEPSIKTTLENNG